MKRIFLLSVLGFTLLSTSVLANTSTLNGLIHYALKNSTVVKQSQAQIEL